MELDGYLTQEFHKLLSESAPKAPKAERIVLSVVSAKMLRKSRT